MKKFYFIIILLLFSIDNASSQTICTTPGNVPNFLATIPSSSLLPPASSYQIRVYAHIVRTTGGTGGMTQAELNSAMSILNQDYLPLGICFTLIGQDYINNSSYFNGSINQSIFSVNVTPNAIDMYFLPNSCPSPGGLAQNIVAKAFVVGGTWTNNPPNVIVNTSHIVSHEMGHCLGLYHTHHGTLNEGTPGECPELVNGSNSSICGDFVTDTPADPYLGFNVNTSCVWLGSGTDANGQAYNPDENIIMAYTSPACMQYLTNGQGQRILQSIANSPILQQVAITNGCCVNDLVINTNVTSGQDNQQAANTITANNSISSGATAVYHAGTSVVFTPSFNATTGSILHAYVEGCTGNFVAKQNTTNDNAINSFDLVKDKINIAPNPNNGIFKIILKDISEGTIQVSDLYGYTVYKVDFKDQNEFEMNMQDKPKGIYIVKVIYGNKTFARKIIKE